MGLLEMNFLGNGLQQWGISLLAFSCVYVGLRVAKRVLIKRVCSMARLTKNNWDDLLASVIECTKSFFIFFVAVYAGAVLLKLPPDLNRLISRTVMVIVILQVAVWGSSLITFWIERHMKRKAAEDAATATTIGLMSFVVRLLFFTTLFLVTLNNLGFDITALIAGLGVGGVAIALAVQNILGDLFASLTIVLDKPFVVGDFVVVGEFMGNIEHIGLKTTRIRSLSGEQLIFSNNDLLQSRIRNFKRMFERRVVFSLGVIYQTSLEQLKQIPQIIRSAIESQQNTRFDRCHFMRYGASSLDFETVYWVLSPDFNAYADVNQAINLEIFRRFGEQGIEFAYPTQTLFIEKTPGAEGSQERRD